MLNNKTRNKAGSRIPRAAALTVALIVVTALSLLRLTAWTNRNMREELLGRARMAAGVVNLKHVRALTGTEADLDSDEYLKVKGKITAIRAATPRYRFVYLMRRRADGTVIILADSEPEDSADYSPPGDVYEEISADYLRVFNTQTPATVGPVTDRWGTWISALVPLIDDQTDELVAVVGVDICADTWNLDVAGRAALPAGLLLTLMIGLLAALFASGRVSGSPKPVLRRLLTPLAILISLLMGSAYWLLLAAHNDHLRNTSLLVKQQAIGDLEQILAEQARGLQAVQVPLLRDTALIAALKARDRERLLELSQPLFEELKERHYLTHFNFSDDERVCLLRVHKPDKYGDRFDRFTALEAERTGQVASGVELGRVGLFTLRVVRPVFENGQLIGYMELGKEIEDVLDSIVRFEGVEKILAISKDEIERTQWEAGMAMLGREADWKRLPDHAIIYYSIALPAEADRIIGCEEHDHTHMHCDDEIRFDNRYWRIAAEPVTDASGREIGELVLLYDVTGMKATQRLQTAGAGSIALVLLAALLALVFVMLRRTDAGIRAQHAELRESEEHLSATLRSIGDGVIACDREERVTDLNKVAEELTGWKASEAKGRPLEEVFHIINAKTRSKAPNPVQRALREGLVAGLANDTMLIARNGSEYQIADSCAPVKDDSGEVIGAVLVFRDVSGEYRRLERERFALRFHNAVAEISAAFISLKENSIDDSINDALLKLGTLFSVDRGYVFRFSKDLAAMDNTHEWCAPGVEPQKDRIRDFPVDSMPWLKNAILKLEPVHIPDVEALPPEAETEKREFQAQNIKSLICLPMRDDYGALMGFMGFDAVRTGHAWPEDQIRMLQVVAEITANTITRREAHQALRAREIELKEAHQMAGMGRWDLFHADNSLKWTDTVFEIFEIDPAEFGASYEAFLAAIHPDDRELVDNAWSKSLRDKQPYAIEHRLLMKDGRIKWLSESCRTDFDENGRPVHSIGIVQDITNRKNAQEEVRISRDRYQSLVANIPGVTYRCAMDEDWTMQYMSKRAEDLFGFPASEFIGNAVRSYTSVIHHDDRQLVSREITAAAAAGKPWEIEYRICRKDGTVRWVYEGGSATRDAAGEFSFLSGIIFDITERKRMEQTLQEATEQAEAANIAKSEFLANMSHEIRTPMNGVIGMTGLLLDTKLSDEQRRYAQAVRASGESLIRIINDILDYSKMEAHKLDLEILDFDLLDLLDDFAGATALAAQEKNIELLCSADPDVPNFLRGDPGRLRQILTNLASNAVKFTSAGGEVEIRVSVEEDTNGSENTGAENVKKEQVSNSVLLRFSVRDTGIGIPKEKIGLLFRKFSQLDASTTRQYGGTGLGLTISKQLAELMGGTIGVESEEGKGSVFWFTVRLEKQAKGERRAEDSVPAELSNIRVLITDDNPTNREILSIRLTSWGMRAAEAQNGRDALDMLRRAVDEGDPFRIALVDMQMPGMDGAALGRAVKADNDLAGTRMVMLSSVGAEHNERSLRKIGFDAHETKPVSHTQLKAILSRLLSEGRKPAPRSASQRGQRDAIPVFAGRKARILVAEDNITNQLVALGILKKMGLKADAVANGAEAVRALLSIPYDLVLMDVQMPVMDGLEATRTIRSLKSETRKAKDQPQEDPARVSNIPIIAMTAHVLQDDRAKCVEAGMNDYLNKPVSAQALAAVLEKWLPKVDDERGGPTPAAGKEKTDEPAEEEEGRKHSPEPVFDHAALMGRVMGDSDLARQVAFMFLDDMPRQIEALRDALAAGDGPTVHRQAHSIKGAAANVSGDRLRAAALEMEQAAGAGDLESVKAGMTGLKAQFNALKREIEKRFGRDRNGGA